MLARAGASSLGSSRAAVELTADKLRLAALWKKEGIPTPECRVVRPAEGLPDDIRYPAVLKPTDGAGALDTYLIPEASKWPAEARALPLALLQPLASGTPMSASFLVNDAGTPELIGLGWQRVERESGRFVYRGGTIPAPHGSEIALLRSAVEVIDGLRGFVGLDFVRDDETGRVTLLEINPRPTTSIVGLTRLLPPGAIARSWLRGRGVTVERSVDLAEFLEDCQPVTFLADGSIVS